VNIEHTFRGDLEIDLIAPDGTQFFLKDSDSRDVEPGVHATFEVDLSDESAEGTWRLRINDVFAGDSGYLGNWTLTL